MANNFFERVSGFFSKKSAAELVSKISLYVLVFLLPIFFLPWSVNVLDFNKQALLLFLVFVSLFAWLIEIMISGKIKINVFGIYIPLAILVLVVLASTITSLWEYGSFWGWPLATNESFLTVLCLFLFSFLAMNIFGKKEMLNLLTTFLISWFLALLIAILQVFGKFIFFPDFTKSISFNTVGTILSMGILTAVILPLAMFLFINSKRLWKLFFIIYLVVAVFFLIMLNFLISWLVLAIGFALVIILGALKKEFLETKWLALPMFFLALPILFILFRLQIAGLPNIPPEVFLKNKTSMNIVAEVLKEKPILGSGPGTFVYNFSKFKSPDLNLSNFWNVRFENGTSKIINTVIATGILGGLAVLFLIGIVIFYGIRFLFRKDENGIKSKKEELAAYNGLNLGLLVGILSLTAAFFLYTSNLTLDFAYFLFISGFLAMNFGMKKEFILRPSSLPTLGVTFVFTLIFILGFGFGILEVQRFFAEANYIKGIREMQKGKIDSAIRALEKSVILSSSRGGIDLYLRQLSQIYLIKINEEAARKDISQDDIAKNVQMLISFSINSAKAATDLNSKNVSNWENSASVYQSMIGTIKDSEEWAIKSYDEAIKLEPANPYLFIQKGAVLFRKAELLPKESAADKDKILADAQSQFEKAIQLKSDYFLPHIYLAALFQMKNRDADAIAEFEKANSLTSGNNPIVFFQLGLLYYRNNNLSKAREQFERAVLLDSNYANALYFLGLIYDSQGLKQKAIDKFTKVAELNPSNEELQKILDNLKAGKSALSGVAVGSQSVVPEADQLKEKLPVEKPLLIEEEKPAKKK